MHYETSTSFHLNSVGNRFRHASPLLPVAEFRRAGPSLGPLPRSVRYAPRPPRPPPRSARLSLRSPLTRGIAGASSLSDGRLICSARSNTLSSLPSLFLLPVRRHKR